MSAKDLTIYFQVVFKGEQTTDTGPFEEGASRRTVFVEVSEEGYDDSMESRSADEVAEETALTAASELATQKFAELAENSAVITRLDESPLEILDLEPDLEEDGVKAWLSK
ncbi:MAG: hypothetical protein JOZ31_20195 [Verrucomicrobia bacterium]|nr:hypothetical protein [Verrucomicrobiota bacterium]MBV8485746.1 hypothetical protein [Verrucomicrobiota bacterium]